MAKKATSKKAPAKKAAARPTARGSSGRKVASKGTARPSRDARTTKAAKAPKEAKPAAKTKATASTKKKSVTSKKVAAPPKPARKSDGTATSAAKERPAPKQPSPGRKRRGRDKKAEKFRHILHDRYRSLLQAYANIKGNSRDTNSDGTEDYIDYAVSSYDRDFSLSLTEMERRRIRLVEEALKRIDRGEYGNCMQCGQEIPEKRLEVEPWARHCIRCQELEEQGLLTQRPFDPDYDEDEVLAEEGGALEQEEEDEPEAEDSEDGEVDDSTVEMGDDDADDEEASL